MLSRDRIGLPRRPLRPLLNDGRFPVVQHGALSLVNALQPVSEAAAHACEYRVCPQRAAVEEGSHLEAKLPDADRHAYFISLLVKRGREADGFHVELSVPKPPQNSTLETIVTEWRCVFGPQ